MLITFRSKAYADITMFGDVALQLLKMMGHSGTVPSALMPQDIPAALERLESALAQQADAASPPADEKEGEEPPVSLSSRALPLLELLRAALERDEPVMWDRA